jgi:uncharacterized protein YdeI (YjbR/CyaY-like superfamily)
MKYSKSIEEYLEKSGKWKSAVSLLRDTISGLPLKETVKWGSPVYTVNNKNVVGLGAFKSYVGIWFFQGVFLKDPYKKLMNAQEGTTRGLRQWRFSSVEEIIANLNSIQEYLEEAIDNQKAGKEINPEKKPLIIPPELNEILESSRELRSSFDGTNLTRRREFCEFINTAKQDATKQKRLEKIIPMILSGTGLNDKYK